MGKMTIDLCLDQGNTKSVAINNKEEIQQNIVPQKLRNQLFSKKLILKPIFPLYSISNQTQMSLKT